MASVCVCVFVCCLRGAGQEEGGEGTHAGAPVAVCHTDAPAHSMRRRYLLVRGPVQQLCVRHDMPPPPAAARASSMAAGRPGSVCMYECVYVSDELSSHCMLSAGDLIIDGTSARAAPCDCAAQHRALPEPV